MKNKVIKGSRITVWVIMCVLISCHSSSDKKENHIHNNKKIPSESISIPLLRDTRGIRDILEDRNGNLWFSSPDYVAQFDGINMHYYTKKNGLEVTGNLHEDVNGTIWCENGFRAFRYIKDVFVEEDIFQTKRTKGLWIQKGLNPADTSFVEAGVYEINRDTSIFHPFPIDEYSKNKYLYFPTTKVLKGKDGTQWMATMEKVFAFKDNTFSSIGRKEMGRQKDERQMGIRGIFEDRHGNLWIADNGAGIFVFNGDKTENFTKKYGLDENEIHGNTLHRAFSIAEDSEGVMWFGTVYSGIWSFNPKTEKFQNYSNNEGVLSEVIWKIYRTKTGDLLFAGESPSAVYKFSGDGFYRIY